MFAVVLVIATVVGIAGPFGGHGARTGAVSDNDYPASLVLVTQGSLSSQLSGSGTLEYATQSDGSNYSVVNQASGTFSQLPAPGRVISRGQVIYRVSNDPVILLYGNTPAYRSLCEGDTGPDVMELNANLAALRDATGAGLDPLSDYFSVETADALERLQGKLGEDETGSLTEGQAVFLPKQIRIAMVSATLGTTAAPGAPIAQATATTRDVVVDLNTSEQTEVKVGDHARITLPAGQTTPGIVTAIGTVAGSGSSGPTLPVYIRLERPQAAGRLDRSPVQIEITTATIKHALIVPIDALLARSAAGYAVETVDARGVHRLLAVTLGTFDDAAGTVQVTGDLHAGEQIVVPNP
ncbi:MAG: hypothetical protein ACLPZR_11130 [Solirubrobacteraceae bacterium]